MNDIGEMSNFLNDIILIENLFNNKFSNLKQEQETARNTYAKNIIKYENKPKPRNNIKSFVELVFGGQTHISSLQTWLDKLVGQCNKENIKIISQSGACCKKIERAFYKSFYVYLNDDGYNDMTDVMRCSLVFDNFADIYKTFSIMELMADETVGGLLRVKDRFHPETMPFGYRDLMINLYCPGAQIICEIQLHHKLFFDLKKISHKMYKRARLFEREQMNLAYQYATKYMRPKIGKLKVYQAEESDYVNDDDEKKEVVKFGTLLKMWGLQKYIGTFEEEGWDDVADWQELTDEDLKEMKLGTGHMKKFWRKYKEWKTKQIETEKVEEKEAVQAQQEELKKDESEVGKVLGEWGLQKYVNTFIDEGYDDPSIWNELTEKDLQDLKLSKGHIKKFLIKAKALKLSSDSSQLIPNGEYLLQCQYKNSYMFEFHQATGYNVGGKSMYVAHNTNATQNISECLWKIEYLKSKEYYTIKSVDSGRYLYESGGKTGYNTGSGNKSMFIAAHQNGNSWSNKKGFWMIERSAKDGYFILKSLWRNSYIYAADTLVKDRSEINGAKNCHCAGNVESTGWGNGKGHWKVIPKIDFEEKTQAQIIPNGTYKFQSQYKNSVMFEFDQATGYKDSGGKSMHVVHNSNAVTNAVWNIQYLPMKNYYTIQCAATGRYLYESGKGTGYTSAKGNSSMFISAHNNGNIWGNKKGFWMIEKSATKGYFVMKSLWRNSYLYAADTVAKNKSVINGVKNCHCAGNVEGNWKLSTVRWRNGKGNWKLIAVSNSNELNINDYIGNWRCSQGNFYGGGIIKIDGDKKWYRNGEFYGNVLTVNGIFSLRRNIPGANDHIIYGGSNKEGDLKVRRTKDNYEWTLKTYV